MARLSLTLDAMTLERLEELARRRHTQRESLVRRLIEEGLERQERLHPANKKLAVDYSQGRADSRSNLRALEVGQLELMGEDV